MIYTICDYCGLLIADVNDQVNLDVNAYAPEVTGQREGYHYHRKCYVRLSNLLEEKKAEALNKARR